MGVAVVARSWKLRAESKAPFRGWIFSPQGLVLLARTFGYRARRIVELIEATPSLSIEDMQAIQGDSSPVYAREVLPYLLALSSSDPRLAQALDLLRAWDGRAMRDSRGAALFEAVRFHMVDLVFGDELGEQLMSRAWSRAMVALVNLLPDPTSPWFDDTTTPEVETRDDILQQALKEAVEHRVPPHAVGAGRRGGPGGG